MTKRTKSPMGAAAIAVVVGVAVVVVIGLGLWIGSGAKIPSLPQAQLPLLPPPTGTGTGTTTTSGVGLQIYVELANWDTGAGISSPNVDVYKTNNAQIDTFGLGTSGTGNSNKYFYIGDTIYLRGRHSSYYPTDAKVTITPDMLVGGSGQTQYYSVVKGTWTNILTSDTGPGPITLKQRMAGASTTFSAKQSGTTLRDTTFNVLANQPTWAGATNTTITGSTWTLQLAIDSAEYSVHWGVPVKYIDVNFQSKTLYGAFIISFNSTQPKASEIVSSGFTSINNPPTGWSVFYMMLDGTSGKGAPHSTQTVYESKTYPITMDYSSVTDLNDIDFRVFAFDFQLADDIASGGSSAIPTARGAYSGYGLTAILPNTTYSLSSSAPVGSSLSFMTRYDV